MKIRIDQIIPDVSNVNNNVDQDSLLRLSMLSEGLVDMKEGFHIDDFYDQMRVRGESMEFSFNECRDFLTELLDNNKLYMFHQHIYTDETSAKEEEEENPEDTE